MGRPESARNESAALLSGLVERAVDAFVSPRLPDFPEGLATLVGADTERRFRRQVPTVLSMVLRTSLDTFCRHHGRDPEAVAPAPGPAGLQLVDDRAIERRIAFGNVVRKVDAQGERGLWMLNARLAHAIGLESIDDDASPFRPQLFVESIGRAWHSIDPDGDHEMTVVRTYGRELVGRITAVYPRLNDWLDERKIAVEIAARFVVQRSKQQLDRTREPQASPAADLAAPAARWPQGRASASAELQAAVAAFFGAASTASAGAPIPDSETGDFPAPPPSPLLGALPALTGEGGVTPESARVARERLLGDHPELASIFAQARQVGMDLPTDLQRLSGEIESQPVPAHEKRTVELLCELFSSLYADENLPVAVKARIGELQLAVLRSTLHDQRLLYEEAHPLRRLIDGLASAGASLQPDDGVDEPLVRKITEIVERARDAAGDDPRVFGELEHELSRFVAEEEAAAEQRVAARTPAQGTELQAADARLAADAAIAERLDSNEVPAFMNEMLRTHWSEVMAIAHLRRVREPEAWANAERLLDQLVWSVTPKRVGAERQQLIRVLPGLLVSLRAAFDEIMWRDESREAFLGKLAQLHASMVGGKLDLPSGAAERKPGAVAGGDTSREAREMSAELSPLQRGLLFDMAMPDGTTGRYRLSWVSPMRTRFVFTNREGREAQTCSASELIVMLSERRIRLIDRDSAFERALISALKAATRRSSRARGA